MLFPKSTGITDVNFLQLNIHPVPTACHHAIMLWIHMNRTYSLSSNCEHSNKKDPSVNNYNITLHVHCVLGNSSKISN